MIYSERSDYCNTGLLGRPFPRKWTTLIGSWSEATCIIYLGIQATQANGLNEWTCAAMAEYTNSTSKI